jgi:SsrA-binding protein
MKKEKKGIYVQNRKARFEYFLLETFEAGIALTGTEIKSIRLGGAELTNSYIFVNKENEVWTDGLKIRKPKTTTEKDFNPERPKKLLLHKRQILKLAEKMKEKGLTIIPVVLYTNARGFAKLQIAIAKGKADYDKRKTIKERDLKRQDRKEER